MLPVRRYLSVGMLLNPRVLRIDFFLVSAYAQGICHTIDVVEPRSDQRDLENALIIKPDCPQALVIFAADARGVPRDLGHVIQHHSFLF